MYLYILCCRTLESFWPTTGIFPQEFIVSFSALMSIGNIKIICSNGRVHCQHGSSINGHRKHQDYLF